MNVVINGLDKLATDDFNQIIITEKELNDFLIRVIGDGQGTKDNFSKVFNELSVDEKISLVVKKYLDVFKINGVNKLLPVPKSKNKWALVYGENGKKELRMQIYSPRFKFISKMIMDKYLSDRYDVLFNTEYSHLNIDIDDNLSKYEVIDDKVNLTLMSNDNILVAEREFLQELIYYKFSQVKEMAKITEVYDKENNRPNVIIGYVVTCGNMKITFSKSYKCSLILYIIREYNREREYKKKVRK